MADPEFCTIQDVNDLLGTRPSTGALWIVTGGAFDPTRVERRIQKRSGIINDEHGMNYNSTTVTEEYHDTVSNPIIMTDYYPIISITSLYLYNGSEYVAKTEGFDRNNYDFFIKKASSGRIQFWETPDPYFNGCRLTYVYGHSTIPEYVRECCSKMVAIDLAMDRKFKEECKDMIKKWHNVIENWMSDIEDLLNNHIRKTPLGVKSIGKWYLPSVTQQLDSMSD